MHAGVHTRATAPGAWPKPLPALRRAQDGRAATRADVGALAHDLRNVLTSVRGYAQLLLSLVEDDRSLEYLSVIESESGRCCRLIERMLMPADPAPEEHSSNADAARALERVRDLACGEAALRGVGLDCEVEDGLPPAAIRQEDFERVLLNLVRNGVQATPTGGRVELRAHGCSLGEGEPGVEIEVSDTGQGISENMRKAIFQPFFSTRNPGECLGLGLSICSVLVERCGGSIDVKSGNGTGSTFAVRLPAATSGPTGGEDADRRD